MESRFSWLRTGVILVALLSVTTMAISQNCVQTLKRAQQAYDEGRISQVPYLLEECLDDGFSREEKAAAFRLLTLTYLYLDEPIKADESILRLLKLSPEYKINKAVDPAEFINLYNKYRTKPIFNIGFKGGLNYMFINVKERMATNGDEDKALAMKSTTGFQLGILNDVRLSSKISLATELFYMSKEFSYNYSVAGQSGIYTEKLNLFSLPILLKYEIGNKIYIPFVNVGGEISYLSSALGSTGQQFISPTTDFKHDRNRFLYAAIIGAGIKTKLGPGFLSIGARYSYGLNSAVRKSQVYAANGSWSMSYGSVPSIYYINTISVDLAYLIPVYKPKKIKP